MHPHRGGICIGGHKIGVKIGHRQVEGRQRVGFQSDADDLGPGAIGMQQPITGLQRRSIYPMAVFRPIPDPTLQVGPRQRHRRTAIAGGEAFAAVGRVVRRAEPCCQSGVAFCLHDPRMRWSDQAQGKAQAKKDSKDAHAI
jgi:hypothetical protein